MWNSQEQFDQLEDGTYSIHIDSKLFEGVLNYGELLIGGKSSKEVFISTYVCHPSMANNELSGPTVVTFLAKWLAEFKELEYSYRIIFIPETIGSILYLSLHYQHMKKNVFSGFNVSCIGDNRAYSYLPSRNGNTLSDRIAKHVLKHIDPNFKSYSWFDLGSDERQYCAPNVDLPIASIMRTKYGMYDEYHTSLDDLINVVTAKGLEGGFNALWKAIEALERNSYPKVKILCEPQLGKRDLYPALLTEHTNSKVMQMLNLITWSDGAHSLIDIAELCESPIWELYPIVKKLEDHKLIELYNEPS